MGVKVRNLATPLILAFALVAAACGGGDSDADVADAQTTIFMPTSTSVVVATQTVPAPTTVPTATTAPTATKPPSPTAVAVPTSTAVPTATVAATATSVPTPVPTPKPTSTPIPTPVPTPVSTVPPTATTVPTATPTVGPPTPTPTATPIGYSAFTGNGNAETDIFVSPPNLPWVIEWEAQGTGANTITVMLMDPEDGSELIEIINDSGTGQIGGTNLVVGNMGTFFLRIEGPDSGWKIWIRQQ